MKLGSDHRLRYGAPIGPQRRHRHKFGAVQVERDGHKFPSKLEGKYFDQLLLRQKAGDVLFFLRQVPLHFPGGGKMVVDFVEFLADGTVEFVDTKGKETVDWLAKKRMAESLYPVRIKVVSRV